MKANLSSTFFRKFEKIEKLSADPVQLGFSLELDHQLIGQAHDLGAAGAEATLDTVLVGAGGGCDGDFAAFDGDGVAAAVGGRDGDLLILLKIQHSDALALRQNTGAGSRGDGPQQV